MSARGERHTETVLRLVDPDTGEFTEAACKHCAAKDDEFNELMRKFRSQSRELAELRRDRDAEARAHEAWPTLIALFNYWREQTGHERSKWTAERFWCALPLWKKYGTGNVAAAIAGLAYEPNQKPLKNGKMEVYDDWELLFRDTGKFERYMRRRPAGWQLPDSLKDVEPKPVTAQKPQEVAEDQDEREQRSIAAIAG